MGFESAAPRMRMPYSVSMPRTLGIATLATLPPEPLQSGAQALVRSGDGRARGDAGALRHRAGSHPPATAPARVAAQRGAAAPPPAAGARVGARRRRRARSLLVVAR